MMLTARRVIIALVLAALAVGAFYAWALHRAFTGAAQQLAETPAEKKIEASGVAKEAAIDAEAEKQKQEVDGATGDQLLDLARKRLLDGK